LLILIIIGIIFLLFIFLIFDWLKDIFELKKIEKKLDKVIRENFGVDIKK
jgi:hypothetical protein